MYGKKMGIPADKWEEHLEHREEMAKMMPKGMDMGEDYCEPVDLNGATVFLDKEKSKENLAEASEDIIERFGF